jgi:hypothetical protein
MTDGQVLWITDPDGNRIELVQWPAEPNTAGAERFVLR